MGRRAKGWEIRPRGKKKVLYIRFRRAGVRYEISTGTSDVREADARAAEIYAEHLTRRPEPKLDRPAKLHLSDVAAKWIPAIRGSTHASNTATLYELHLRAHLIAFFERLDNVSTGTIGEYQRTRLKEVTRATVIKERSTLASFLSWCKEQGLIPFVPEFPPIPKGALGHRAGARKQKAVDVSPEQVARFLAALPEMSIGKIRQSHRFPVRARYIVAWETGLRPSTLDKLSVPEHYKKGQRDLVITDSIDKARFGRSLPLTEAARAALDSVVTKKGLVFGRRCYRMYVSAARLAAEMPAGFSPYDLRHGRALALTEASGNLPGVAFLLGHRKLTTTDRYLRATRRAADAVLASVAPAQTDSGAYVGGSVMEAKTATPEEAAVSTLNQDFVRRTRLELVRSYPLAPQENALLDIAADPAHSSTAEDTVRRGWMVVSGGMPPVLADDAPRVAGELRGIVKASRLLNAGWDSMESQLLAIGGDE